MTPPIFVGDSPIGCSLRGFPYVLSYPSVISYGEPLATWLAVWPFCQVISMSALQAQGCGFDPHCGQERNNILVSSGATPVKHMWYIWCIYMYAEQVYFT